MGLRNALQLRLSDDILAKVIAAATLQGLPPSTYGRLEIEKAAIRDLEDSMMRRAVQPLLAAAEVPDDATE